MNDLGLRFIFDWQDKKTVRTEPIHVDQEPAAFQRIGNGSRIEDGREVLALHRGRVAIAEGGDKSLELAKAMNGQPGVALFDMADQGKEAADDQGSDFFGG